MPSSWPPAMATGSAGSCPSSSSAWRASTSWRGACGRSRPPAWTGSWWSRTRTGCPRRTSSSPPSRRRSRRPWWPAVPRGTRAPGTACAASRRTRPTRSSSTTRSGRSCRLEVIQRSIEPVASGGGRRDGHGHPERRHPRHRRGRGRRRDPGPVALPPRPDAAGLPRRGPHPRLRGGGRGGRPAAPPTTAAWSCATSRRPASSAVAGDEANLKITTRLDMVLADRMIQMQTLDPDAGTPSAPVARAAPASSSSVGPTASARPSRPRRRAVGAPRGGRGPVDRARRPRRRPRSQAGVDARGRAARRARPRRSAPRASSGSGPSPTARPRSSSRSSTST